MKNSNLKALYKNNRYRVVCSNSKQYLIDADSPWFGYVFFWLRWLVPQKVYILDERDADDLLVHHVDIKNNNKMSLIWLSFIILGFNIILPNLVNIFYKNSTINYSQFHQFGDSVTVIPSTMHSLLLLLLASFPAIVIRIFLAQRSKRRIVNKIQYENLPVTKIKIIPATISTVIKNIVVYFLFALLVIAAGFLLVISEGYWIISLSFTLLLLFFLLTNNLALSNDKYKICEIKEK
ncbi:DUF443 family protein [Enterococcus rotai]|uniref:DUF443 family protein n=1 Tax=Enterococcus rotai TaxID=118060 RepID=UPI0035C73D10